MKRMSRHLWMAALCVAIGPASALAQTSNYFPAASGEGVVQASALMATGSGGGEACNACSGCCDNCCGSCMSSFGCNWPCGCSLSDLGEACKLWKPHCEESQWSAAGWLAQGYVWNPYRPADKFNGPLTWNDRAN